MEAPISARRSLGSYARYVTEVVVGAVVVVVGDEVVELVPFTVVVVAPPFAVVVLPAFTLVPDPVLAVAADVVDVDVELEPPDVTLNVDETASPFVVIARTV